MKKSLLMLLTAFASLSAVAAPWADWDAFKTASVENGRVVDASDERLITTSEGESYALFFALVAGDKAAFESILSWTEKNLAAGDMGKTQPAWLWGRKTADDKTLWTVLDANNAADSDMWIAYALLEAGRLWHRPDYTEKAHGLMALLKKDVRRIKNLGAVILPGRTGFEHADGSVKLNPSYAPLFILSRFAQEDDFWRDVKAGSLRMLLRSAPDGFAPDWATFDKEGRLVAIDDEDNGIGSYNAIRTYLWVAMTTDAAGSALVRRFEPMVKVAEMLGRPPEKVQLANLAFNRPGNAGFAGCVLAIAQMTGHFAAADRLRTALASHDISRESYYTNVLALFARGLDEGRYLIDADGRVKIREEVK